MNTKPQKSHLVAALFLLASAVIFAIVGVRVAESDPGTVPAASAVALDFPLPVSTSQAPSSAEMIAANDTYLPTSTPNATPTQSPTAAAVPTLAPPQLVNPPVDALVQEAAAFGGAFQLIDAESTGIWQFMPGSFLHPIALELWHDTLFLLDAGRVLSFDLTQALPPQVLLSPGDNVEDTRVLEPLDLTILDDQLYLLDRVGDVYRYDLTQSEWAIDRPDRSVRDSTSHYFVAISGTKNSRLLLETNYKYGMSYVFGEELLWNLPEARAIDTSATEDGDVYVLMQDPLDDSGILLLYRDMWQVRSFRPTRRIAQPRQVVATQTAVYVLDLAGQRLLELEPQYGTLIRLFQLPQQDTITTFGINAASGSIILAGADRLYFYGQPERLTSVAGEPDSSPPMSYDARLLQQLVGLAVPIEGSPLTQRDTQMPGAPRHYRLGVHEGLDFYWQPGTLVRAVDDGLVIRAALDYQPATTADITYWSSETTELGYTSDEGLDFFRGMQVWIEHENGLVSRYTHLSSIDPAVVEGARVVRNQLIGQVGNSGSPESIISESEDAHLHFELRMGDHYVGQFLRPIEIREWMEDIFLYP